MNGSRIVILCEGDTEEIAVKHFLRRQWQADQLSHIALQPINLRGKLEDLFSFVPLYHRDEKTRAVFTMIDLYGMTRVKHKPYDSLSDKVKSVKLWLTTGLLEDFSAFFFPHLCVHEIEAWILAEGRCLSERLADPRISPEPNAELQNFTNHPSRKIDQLFKSRRGTQYNKITDGTVLFKCLRFETIYGTCEYFRLFYDELRSVARN